MPTNARHWVNWDTKYNRPIVGGKVENPETGQVEDADSKSFGSGPPAVDVIWHNIDTRSNFHTVRKPFNATVDEVYLQIGNHVRDKIYSIISISASAYSFVIVCSTEKGQAEFHEALTRMRDNLYKFPPGGFLPPPQTQEQNSK